MPKPMKLSFIPPPSASNGRPRVIAEADVSEEGSKVWSSTLVGHFVGTSLSFSIVRSIARSIWQKEGVIDVLSYEKGFFLFRFATESGMKSILERGAWLFAGRYMVLMKWKPGLILSEATLHSIPVWDQFFNIPIELWTEKGLSLIASALGKPLFADSATEARSRVNFARICVEVDASCPLVDDFDVEIFREDGSSCLHPIRVSYQWRPPSCHFCKVFGHSSDSCASLAVQTSVEKISSKSPAKASAQAATQASKEDGRMASAQTSVESSQSPAKASTQAAAQASKEDGWKMVGKKGKAVASSASSSASSVQTTNVFDVLPQESDVNTICPPEGIISSSSGNQASEPLTSEEQGLVPDPILPEEIGAMASILPATSSAAPEGFVVHETEPLVSLSSVPNSMVAQAMPNISSPSSVPLRKSGLVAKLRNIDGSISFKGLGPSSGKQGSMQNRLSLLEESPQAQKGDRGSEDRGSELPRFNHDPTRGVSDVLQ